MKKITEKKQITAIGKFLIPCEKLDFQELKDTLFRLDNNYFVPRPVIYENDFRLGQVLCIWPEATGNRSVKIENMAEYQQCLSLEKHVFYWLPNQ